MLERAWVLLVVAGCRGPAPCVAVSDSDRTGRPVRTYDEFTQVSSITSEYLFTPDQEWTLSAQREDGVVHWSIELWLRSASSAPVVDVTLRVTCSQPAPESEDNECINCDNVCTEQNGRLEMLADGLPIQLPATRYRRLPVEPPTPESRPSWASTLSLGAEPAVLYPLERARTIKLRVCGAIVATLTAAEAASLREFLGHQRALAPVRR